MEVYQQYVQRMLKLLVITTIVIAVLLYVGGGARFVGGWLWGGGTNCVYFVILAAQVRRWPEIPPEKLKNKIRMTVVSRFILVLAMTAIATRIAGVHMLGVLAGMILLTPLQYLDYWLGQRRKSLPR